MPTHTIADRTIIVDLPTIETAPVMLCFHGGLGSPGNYRSQLDIDMPGMYVVYMSSSTDMWDLSLKGDIKYVNDALKELTAIYPSMDTTSIKCLGHSNGGQMACAYADKNADVNTIYMTNSAIPRNYTDFNGLVKHIHSINDLTIPYGGNSHYFSVEQTRTVFSSAGATYIHISVNGDHTLASVKQGLLNDWGTDLNGILGT